MTGQTRIVPLCLLVLCSFSVFVQSIDIDFDDNRDGYFLKSPYHKFKPAEPSVVKESLILTHPAEVYKLRASYHGRFPKHQAVPSELLNNVLSYGEPLDSSDSHMHRQVFQNMDVSAHLVTQQVSQSNPAVQVLIHAEPLARRLQQELIYSQYSYSQKWCAQIFATKGGEEITGVCLLNGGSNACVAGLHLLDNWWKPDNVSDSVLDQEVRMYYDISHIDQNQECASVSNTIIPSRLEQSKPVTERKFISTIELIHERRTYEEHKDKDIIFQIPKLDLHPNSKFEVPVLLEKNSGLKEFVIKVKVRGPLRVEGVSPSEGSPWTVMFEPGDKEGVATVTASLKEDVKYTKSFRQEEVMRWQFCVVGNPLGILLTSTARVVWTVDYERNGLSRNSYFPPEGSRIAVKFNILESQAEIIVPVLKERSLLNTAVLTGKMEKYDLHIYSITGGNTFRELTKDISCRSTDPEALKVSATCNHFYLDGSETRGAKNVTLVVRTANHMAQFGIRVWVPEPRLDIQFSDSKLSQIKGWKVARKSSSLRSKRSIDLGLLTHPNVIDGSDDDQLSNPPPFHKSCRYKYQQAVLEVYARFIISTPGEAPRFYRNMKTYVRVTKLVKGRLQTANRNVAKIIGTTVQGIAPGKTDVQVVSPTGILMGAKEIRVGKDKVDIERLMVRVISDLALHITEDRNLPGALMATVDLQDHLHTPQQDAVLDIALEFKDGTTLPLDRVDPSHYSLKVTSVNPDVVEVVSSGMSLSGGSSTSNSLPPAVKAVGNGKGDIVKVTLRERDNCHRRKVRTLDTEYVHVMVDFSKAGNNYGQAQRDGNFFSNHASKDPYNKKQDYFKDQKRQQLDRQNHQDYLGGHGKDTKAGHKVYHLKDVYDKLNTFTASSDTNRHDAHTEEPRHKEAFEQPVSTRPDGPSPLEIGMYVLVGVFLFAIFVFTANCAVFMMRYRRKQGGGGGSLKKGSHHQVMKGSISQAPDWVWIGRDTLERNGARHTGCHQPLMAEEDFNGNQMVIPNSLSSVSSKPLVSNSNRHSTGSDSSSGVPNSTSSSSSGVDGSSSVRNSMTSTYKGSECSIRITSNPFPPDHAVPDTTTANPLADDDDDSGMGYNEAEWDYEAMGMTYEQLMEYFDNLKESSA